MKTLFVLLSLIALNLSVSARPPHEKTGGDSIYNEIQLGKIHAAMLNMLDEDIYTTQNLFDQEINNLTETDDFVEGKIQAHMIASIGHDLLKIKEARANLEDKAEIVDADVEQLHNRLNDLRKIIGEINLK